MSIVPGESPRVPYLILFRESQPEIYETLPETERTTLRDQWNGWYDGLEAVGKVEHGHPLHPQGRVVSGTLGERIVDGPFAEAKEAIGGYFLLMVSGMEEATEIAQHCPSLKYGMSVEVRPVAEACPELGVRGRAQRNELAQPRPR